MEVAWHKLWKLFLKYKEVVLYLVFGGLTTLINIVVYAVCARWLGLDTLRANASALTISILFAYITNKLFVFESKTDTIKEVFREFFSFIACRLGTGALDMVFMFVSVDILGFYDVAMKVLSNIIVIVLNYVFSKLVIFAKK
ncbi:MAG TPA: teichoic acid glycosylation protein [Lachnospiraceae bacterium]|nr:teichoic acid glycosylation protein [Lachnospiraceae bacterium]